MIKRLFAFFALAAFVFSAAAVAQYTTNLHFPDGSLEICPTTNYSIDFVTLDVAVTSCVADSIFHNGFESSTQRPERNQ